jgi:4a-hydroxytetrahydrobiopterin dehydratase
MKNLLNDKCLPCESIDKTHLLGDKEIAQLMKSIPEWKIVKSGNISKLQRHYKFPDFQSALDYVNALGKVAEQEGHHPDVGLGYGYVKLEIYTHSIKGLTKNDFILANEFEIAYKENSSFA